MKPKIYFRQNMLLYSLPVVPDSSRNKKNPFFFFLISQSNLTTYDSIDFLFNSVKRKNQITHSIQYTKNTASHKKI